MAQSKVQYLKEYNSSKPSFHITIFCYYDEVPKADTFQSGLFSI